MKLVKVELVSDSNCVKGEVGHALWVFNCVKDARAAKHAGIYPNNFVFVEKY